LRLPLEPYTLAVNADQRRFRIVADLVDGRKSGMLLMAFRQHGMVV